MDAAFVVVLALGGAFLLIVAIVVGLLLLRRRRRQRPIGRVWEDGSSALRRHLSLARAITHRERQAALSAARSLPPPAPRLPDVHLIRAPESEPAAVGSGSGATGEIKLVESVTRSHAQPVKLRIVSGRVHALSNRDQHTTLLPCPL